MRLIINNSSMVPIYEQIVEQVKGMIVRNELAADTMLPSVRALAGELKISALTVKKAYDALEEAGFVVTVHGKGTFVSATNRNLVQEEQRKEVETLLAEAVRKGEVYGISAEEIKELLNLILEG